MEDTHVFKGEMCYSLRIDIPTTKENDTIICNKMKEYFSRLVGGKENKKDGTMHYQCIAWSNNKLEDKEKKYIRSWVKQTFKIEHKNFMSLVKARKVTSLAKYCNNKEEKGLITFGINDLSALGKWQNPTKKKENMKETLLNEIRKMNQSAMIDMRDIVALAIKVYKDCRPPPFKSLLVYARSVGYINDKIFMEEFYGETLKFTRSQPRLSSTYCYPQIDPYKEYYTGDTESESD